MHFLLEARKEPYFSTVTGVVAAEIGKKIFFFSNQGSEKRGKADVLQRKHVQEPKKTAVRPALLDGRLAGAKVVVCMTPMFLCLDLSGFFRAGRKFLRAGRRSVRSNRHWLSGRLFRCFLFRRTHEQ